MPKKTHNNTAHHLNIASIVQRLPLHQHIHQSRSELLKLSPHWLSWLTDNFSTELTMQVALSSLQNGQLVINCANAVSASQIKHQQASLKKSLEQNGFTHIERIKICIDHTYNKIDPSYSTSNVSSGQYSSNKYNQSSKQAMTKMLSTERLSPGAGTIKVIENCKKQTSNEDLSNSLDRLAKTLSDLGSQS